MRTFFAVFICAALAACANGYSQFYHPNASVSVNDPRLEESLGEPEIISGTNEAKDSKRLVESGYMIVGHSSFFAGEVSPQGAIEQAKAVKAVKVVIYKKFKDTVSGVVPLTLPDYQTTYHSGTVSSYGGMASYGGTSTTYGTTTTYIPYTENRFDYLATFWRKQKEGGLGILVRELTTDEKQKIGSNKGAAVSAVRRGSVAYEADILEGFLLRMVDGNEVRDQKSAIALIRQTYGRETEFVFINNGKEIKKKLFVPSYK